MKREIQLFAVALILLIIISSLNLVFNGCAGSKPRELTPEERKALQDSLFKEHKRHLMLLRSFAHEPYKHGDYARAKKYYKQLAEEDTTGIYQHIVFKRLGTCYTQLGLKDSAEWAYSLGVKRNPKDPYNHKMLAWIYKTEGRISEAIDEYKTLIQLQPDSLSYYRDLGELYVKNEQIDDAIAVYQKAVDMDPTNKAVQETLDNLLAHTDNIDALIAQREKMVERFPDDLRLRLDLAKNYFDIGEFEKAVDQLIFITQKDSENKIALEMLGKSYEELERYLDASSTYKKILAFDPKDKKNICNLAISYSLMNRYSQAMREVNRALRIDPDYGLAHITKGMIYERSADRCVEDCGGKIDFNDKLVYKMAYDEYKKALKDLEWRPEAEIKIKNVESQIPQDKDYFMHKHQRTPNKPCYNWIK